MKQGPEYTLEANIKMCDMEFYVSLIGGAGGQSGV